MQSAFAVVVAKYGVADQHAGPFALVGVGDFTRDAVDVAAADP